MKLAHLFETQNKLDDRIVKEKGLEGVDLLDKKVLALLVELGELSNEWRGFKFWSEDREPRGERTCQDCGGQCHWLAFVGTTVECEENCQMCNGEGVTNKLLEEYVDVLHFILSIGNELDMHDIDVGTQLNYIKKDITDQFNGMFDNAIRLKKSQERFHYASLIKRFHILGDSLGFTWEQIETAYYSKNKLNHTRQDNGY